MGGRNAIDVMSMKKRIQRLAVCLLLGTGLLACNKEQSQEPLQPSVQTSISEGVIDAEIGLATEEARLAHLVDPTTGAVQGLKLPEGNFDVMLAIKRGSEGPVVQRLTFKKQTGVNKAVYKGRLRIPKNGSGSYEVAAVLVRQLQGGCHGYRGRRLATITCNSELSKSV